MTIAVSDNIRRHLTLARTLQTPAERNELYRSVRRGSVVRVCRGAYIAADLWNRLDSNNRYLAVIVASADLLRTDAVFSYGSAALLWRLPWLGSWPERAHITTDTADGGRSTAIAHRHTEGVPADTAQIDGLAVTTLARTSADLIRRLPFGPAVVVADAALRRGAHPIDGVPRDSITKGDLWRELDRVAPRQGAAKAGAVIGFADAAADRPGESMSRVGMHVAGVTPPLLQVDLFGASGRRYTVDFWWPQFGVIGEFDGAAKYRDPEFLRGRTPEKALLDEKDREDDLRAAGHRMTRWRWATALSPRALQAHLARAGVS